MISLHSRTYISSIGGGIKPMKRLLAVSLFTALAAATLGATGASAQPYGPPPPHGGYGPPPPGYGHPHGPPPPPPGYWHRGGYYHGNRGWVDYHYYHLPPPRYGYNWVQSGGQFLLIGINTGVIIDIR
jgi:hypothetical protein